MIRDTMNAKNVRPAVNRHTCITCGACAAACPTEALVIEGMALVILEERCRPCGQAALVCPTGALRCPGRGDDAMRSRGASPNQMEGHGRR